MSDDHGDAKAASARTGSPPGEEVVFTLDADKLEFFEREADHFFRGELAHEQRAAWLLALASALLVAQWRAIGPAGTSSMTTLSFVLMVGTMLALVVSVGLSLWALWPLGGGRNPGLLRPWKSRHSSHDPSASGSTPILPERYRVSASELIWSHYMAHRRRAEIKGRRVVCVTISLFVALLVGAAGILSTTV